MAEAKSTTRYEPTTRRPRSAETRARLLQSALSLFREQGYHGAGTNDIGAAAGLTGPSIYRHFATKDELLVAAVLEGARSLGHGLAQALEAPDPVRALEVLCSTFVASALKDPDLMYVYFYEARHMPSEAQASLEMSAKPYLAHYEHFLAASRPELSAEEVHIRVLAASHMVGGMCTDLPDVSEAVLADVLTARMLATLLGDVVLQVST
ncbi:MAG TPA: TetR/AcrR family transcriptional regulator [Acidimicrobiales bacterium]|jgi:AcrR family transcriptional regulator|nr:TetR/AcrR family transcriptional regulator [Acidimicrobiales bacterium]